MNYYFIVSNDGCWRMNWETLKSHLPADTKVMLIADPYSVEMITASASHFLCVIESCSSFEYESLKKIITQLLSKYLNQDDKFNIVTVNEDDLLTCVKLRDYFKIAGESMNDLARFTNKASMKETLSDWPAVLPKYQLFNQNDFRQDAGAYVDEIIKAVGMPVFVKPIIGSACKNSLKLNTAKELLDWCERHQNSDTVYEFDEYIIGDVYCCDSIVQNGDVVVSNVIKYIDPPANILAKGKKAFGGILLAHDDELALRIKSFSQSIIKKFKTQNNCCIHLELFVTSDNKIVFLEIAKRLCGFAIPDIYAMACHVNYREFELKSKLNIDVNISPKFSNEHYAYLAFLTDAVTIKTKCELPRLNSQIVSMRCFKNVGDTIHKLDSFCQISGEVILSHANRQKLLEDIELLSHFNLFVGEPIT